MFYLICRPGTLIPCSLILTSLLIWPITTDTSLESAKILSESVTETKDILINGDHEMDKDKLQKEKNLARARGQVCDFHFTIATENVERLCTDPKLINRVEELEVKLERFVPETQPRPSVKPVTNGNTSAVVDELKQRVVKLETDLQELQKKALDSVSALEEKEFTNVPNATEDQLELLSAKLPRGIQLTGVRLSHGAYGRVEILMNNVWGTACDDDWDLRHANVVCRELGYSGARRATKKGHFGRGEGPVWLDDIRCTGQESSLFSCGRASSQAVDCEHTEDAGAVCSGLPLRLTNTYRGRLEVYYNGRWGTVCDQGWDILEARVICRQMGYTSAVRVYRGRDTSPGGGPIHMTNVSCTGSEWDFFKCSFQVPDKKVCTHAMDVGLECGTLYCSDC